MFRGSPLLYVVARDRCAAARAEPNRAAGTRDGAADGDPKLG